MTVLTWSSQKTGCLGGVRFVPSPNCDARPSEEKISLLVIHAISLPPGEFGGNGIEALFTNTLDPEAHPYYGEIDGLEVSAHFLIRRDGELIQFVSCEQRAWHAGFSSWRGRERCNDFSIGVELEGCDEQGFETRQYDVLNQLVVALKQRYPIASIIGHSEISPGRKTDPGPCFDWSRVARG
jgi:N-acetyl-anhydromuramoyl-L-alanine amidase